MNGQKITVTAKLLTEELVKAVNAGLPILISGAPGIGKSDITDKVAKITKRRLVLSHPVVDSPIDYKGMPAILEDDKGNKTAVFLPFGNLLEIIKAKVPTIYFIDDMGQAPACVQAACMQLLLARKINGQKISDKVTFIAATNRREDRAGVTGILEPVKSRFVSIVELVVNTEDWIEWAHENDIAPEVIGYIYYCPDRLSTEEATADIVNHPSPRTWHGVSKLLKAGITSLPFIAGAVGAADGTQFLGFLKVYHSLPDLDDIVKNPEGVDIPTDSATQYAIVTALLNKADDDNVDEIFTYVNRMPKDFSILFGKEIERNKHDLTSSHGYITWAAANPDVLL
jgi:hypothetical protein